MQSYGSTVSHELRAPLGSIPYFLKKIMELIPRDSPDRARAEKYFKLIFAQV